MRSVFVHVWMDAPLTTRVTLNMEGFWWTRGWSLGQEFWGAACFEHTPFECKGIPWCVSACWEHARV